jgi:lysozyme family protein
MTMDAFDESFAVVVGHEGGFSDDRDDPGNWTGGAVGVGELHGTKFGISAGAYPTLDIPNLSIEDAGEIYRRDYWDRVQCGSLPSPLALLVFDAAVNNGVSRAVAWLQQATGAEPDGVPGPRTMATVELAIASQGVAAVCAEYLARRLVFMASLVSWREFGLGWARRLCALPYQSMTMMGK